MISINNDRFRIAAHPSWISSVSDSVLIAEADLDDERTILEQFEWDVASRSLYERRIYALPTLDSVRELGNVEFTINPEQHARLVHHIRIWRNGVPRDCVVDSSQFRFFQPEEARNSLIYDGTITAMLPLEDVQPGDVLDVASTNVNISAAFPQHYSGQAAAVPLGGAALFRYRLIYPEALNLQFKTIGGSSQMESSQLADGTKVGTIELRDQDSMRFSMLAPSWATQFPLFQWSSYQSWADVSNAVHDLWAPSMMESLEDPQITAVAKQLYESAETETTRIDATIRFVQNEIRYLSLSEGIRSLVPEKPVSVLTKRYGDCKDKSLLLAILLRRMGYEAWPSLVSVQMEKQVGDMIPSDRAFDHAIVCIRSGNEFFWVDPTHSNQGGVLTSRIAPRFGKGLLICSGGADLAEIPKNTTVENSISINEDIRVFGSRQKLEIRTRASGREADEIRSMLSGMGKNRFEKALTDGIGAYYKNTSAAEPIEFQDDLDLNEIEMFETYDTDQNIENVPSIGDCYVAAAHGIINRIPRLPDSHDISTEIAYPTDLRVFHNIRFHNDWGLKWPSERTVQSGPGFEFGHESSALNGVIENRFRFETTGTPVYSADLKTHSETTNVVFNTLTPVVPTKTSEFAKKNRRTKLPDDPGHSNVQETRSTSNALISTFGSIFGSLLKIIGPIGIVIGIKILIFLSRS